MKEKCGADIRRRKGEHLGICLTEEVEFRSTHTGFDAYRLQHNALPEIDRASVSLESQLFGKRLQVPLIISCMTGGTEEAGRYNQMLAEIAQDLEIGMGVGSQRAALVEPMLIPSYQVRQYAPSMLLLANIGASQLNTGVSPQDCARLVDMIEADALVLHLNPLQECIQRGGSTNFEGILPRIEAVCREISVPVVAKEVGHGISGLVARRLWNAGVSAIDVAGAGGTSWARVESLRQTGMAESALGEAFAEWGIPTAECIVQIARELPEVELIASGGIRNGIDAVKALALGARAVGMGLPLLKAVARSPEALRYYLEMIRLQMETALFCVGASSPARLKELDALIHVCPACGQAQDMGAAAPS